MKPSGFAPVRQARRNAARVSYTVWVVQLTSTRIRRLLRHRRYAVAVLVFVLGLSTAMAVHHGDPMDMSTAGMTLMASTCLAVVATALAVRVVAGVLPLRRPTLPRYASWTSIAAPPPLPRARAGPLFLELQVLLR